LTKPEDDEPARSLYAIQLMTIQVNLPADLIAKIDSISSDRDRFIADAIRQVLRKSARSDDEEVARINAVADELNAEAADVLEYQALS
jgi:metal-responsive CopG/Arc/MetJ family transcriptional regulator